MCFWYTLGNSNELQRKNDFTVILALLLHSRKNGFGRGTSSIFRVSLLNNILIFNIFEFLVLVVFTMEYIVHVSSKYCCLSERMSGKIISVVSMF